MYSRHQAGWFPFRAELQNPRAGEDPQDEAEQNQDMQEMVSYRGQLLPILLQISRKQGILTEQKNLDKFVFHDRSVALVFHEKCCPRR